MSKTIVFQGDSITEAGRVRDREIFSGYGYASLVKGELGLNFPGKYTFYNRGVYGNRIVDVYARIREDLINLKPDYMSLLVGVNDVWSEFGRHDGISAEKFEKIYCMIIDEVLEELPDIKIMILEPFVLEGKATSATEEEPDRWNIFNTEVRERAKVAKKVAEKYGFKFISLQDKFDEAAKKAETSYWLFDGVHPTAMGHALIKNEWLKAFNEIK